jgi:GT2 family glycosyltransferase
VPDAPRFTIVVPTHERPAQLRNCLQGLARLNYPRDRIDVVVVDDGSGQPPEREVEEARQALRVDLVTQGNAGPGGARNTGVARASGEYVAFLGDDCEPAADWLHALASRLSRAPDCLVGGRIVNALPSNPYSSASNRLISYLYRHYNADPELARFLTPNNMAMRRSLFEEVGGFEPAMGATGEDRELCDRWLHRGHRIVHAPEAIVHHSHPLTMGSFWQQQVDYGRGTYRYRARQRQPRPGTLMPERLSFYINLVLFPFSQGAGARAWQEAWLLGVSQVATAAGFFGEALRTARSRQ